VSEGLLAPRQSLTLPDVWNWFSHSYGDGNAGSFDQTGRVDSVFRQAMDIEYTNWRKYAVAGSRLTVEGASAGGWATLWRETSGGKFPGKTFPYTAEGGALVIMFGINDLGTLGGASTQILAGYQQALRSCISRWRASTIFETTASNTVFGGTWTTETNKPDQASSSEWRWTNVVGSTATITLPADYDGSPVVVCFRGSPGTGSGATATYSGTAGVTGTTVTENIMPGATLTGVPVVRRITNLTSANAGQTIIITATTINGLLHYDCWWIESKSPPPVIVANCPRLTATGYSTKYAGWTAQTASLNGDVQALNTAMSSVIAEFDGMVQMADIDAKMSPAGTPDATLFSDGLHPNDRGAALCADALLDATRRLTPNAQYGTSSQMNPPSKKAGAARIPLLTGNYYAPDYSGAAGTVTGTAGTMFAMPFLITEARTTWDTWAVEVSGGTSITAGYQVRVGMFNDLNFNGYPDTNLQELTASGVLNTSTTTGVKTTTGGGYIWRPDPGLYWFVVKVEVVATGTTPTLRTITGPNRYMPNATTAGSIASAGYVGWQLTGQATGVFPTTYPSGATLVTSCPVVTIHRA
jgi:hypothetical protein